MPRPGAGTQIPRGRPPERSACQGAHGQRSRDTRSAEAGSCDGPARPHVGTQAPGLWRQRAAALAQQRQGKRWAATARTRKGTLVLGPRLAGRCHPRSERGHPVQEGAARAQPRPRRGKRALFWARACHCGCPGLLGKGCQAPPRGSPTAPAAQREDTTVQDDSRQTAAGTQSLDRDSQPTVDSATSQVPGRSRPRSPPDGRAAGGAGRYRSWLRPGTFQARPTPARVVESCKRAGHKRCATRMLGNVGGHVPGVGQASGPYPAMGTGVLTTVSRKACHHDDTRFTTVGAASGSCSQCPPSPPPTPPPPSCRGRECP